MPSWRRVWQKPQSLFTMSDMNFVLPLSQYLPQGEGKNLDSRLRGNDDGKLRGDGVIDFSDQYFQLVVKYFVRLCFSPVPFKGGDIIKVFQVYGEVFNQVFPDIPQPSRLFFRQCFACRYPCQCPVNPFLD